MYLVKDVKSPYYHLVYFDESGARKKVSTKEKLRRAAEKFMRNYSPCDFSKAGLEKKDEFWPEESERRIRGLTISVFGAEYVEYAHKARSKSYVISIRHTFKVFLDEIGDIEIRELDNRAMENFLLKMFRRTERGAALYLRTLKAAFTKAEEWGYLKENPLRKVRLPKIAEKFPVFLSFDDLRRISEHEAQEDYRTLYWMAFYTGMRRGEIVHLQWSNVDLERREIKVRNGKGFITKSKKERTIPVCTPLLELLGKHAAKRKEGALYVFEQVPGEHLYDESPGRYFKRAVRAAGLSEKIHFHTLRHSFASALVQNGVSVYVVKELLGHADIATTMVYSHLKKENLVEAISAFEVIVP